MTLSKKTLGTGFKLRLSSVRKKISLFSYFLLFPGFFFYHYSIAMGHIPPFLGGYFGLVSLMLMPIIVILVIPQLFKSISIVEVIFIFILLLILIIATFNYVLSLPIGFVNEMFIWSISGLFINACAIPSR